MQPTGKFDLYLDLFSKDFFADQILLNALIFLPNIVMTVWAMNIHFSSKSFKKVVLDVRGALGIDSVEDAPFHAHPKTLPLLPHI